VIANPAARRDAGASTTQLDNGVGGNMAATTTNEKLLAWVAEWAEVLQPDAIEWCDGSAAEAERMSELLVASGAFQRLADDRRPNSYLALSDPGDVARVEDRTYICSEREIDASSCSAARWSDARCTWCPSAWGRWARPSPTSGCSSPTRPTWW
jgi:GTP-dependent phosphoenolpyruvate carboxykinase